MADRDIVVKLKLESSGNLPQALKTTTVEAAKAATETTKINTAVKQIDTAKTQTLAKGYADTATQAKRATTEVRQLAAETAKVRTVSAGGAAGMPNKGQVNIGGMAGAQAKPEQAAPGLAGAIGATPEFLAAMGTVIAIVKGFSAAMSTAARGIDAFKDSTLTADKAARKTAESIPLLGEFAKSFGELRDAISGKSETIRRAAREEASYTAKESAGLQAYQQNAPLIQQMAANEARSKALAGIPMVGFNPPARDTWQGEQEYAQYERRQPLEMEQRSRQAEAQAAREAADAARMERERQEKNVANTVKYRETIEQIVKDERRQGIGDTSPSSRDAQIVEQTAKVKEALDDELRARQQLATASQQEMAAAQNAATAESNLRKANIALAKEELAVLKEKEQQIKGSAQAFGSLSAMEKQAALESAKALKEKGYDALTPEQKAAIQGAGFGQQLGFAAQQAALANPDFKAISQLFGQEFDLAAIQAKQVEVQAKIALDVQLDESQFADAIKNALEPILKQIIESNEKIAAAIVKKVDVGQEQANASQ